ncbi:hypothetical protein O6H91_20G038600 [Diphasiastrum complanatum]|uniref:Uncharacterized protein n=1 Tax=Diphasiastrum complanatum TaxID=34168 RepID=A0ACC2APP9_DIPCM|nr:hypothetical protein O6H91_20G038600 [Diphasiastrum complanatum]
MVAPGPASTSSYGPVGASVGHWSSMYRWIPIVGAFVAFFFACAGGANDVAASFGTSVGSGALTLLQAVLIACIMELSGAVFAGDRVVDSLQFSSIIKKEPPDAGLLMWGFFIVLIAATLWLAFATYLEMPVSSYAAIVGGVVGISLSTGGFDSVFWNETRSDSVLHVGGILAVVISWFLAPIIATLASFLFFSTTKLFLLRQQKAEERTVQVIPIYYGVTVVVIMFFIIYKGVPRSDLDELSFGKAVAIAGSSGVLATILAYLVVVPLARKRLTRIDAVTDQQHVPQNLLKQEKVEFDTEQQPQEVTADDLIKQFNERKVLDTVYEAEEEEIGDQSPAMKRLPSVGAVRISFGQLLACTPHKLSFRRLRSPRRLTNRQKVDKFFQKFKASTFGHKIGYSYEVAVWHTLAEKFDKKAEELFGFLQVLTSCAAAFSHGANDIPTAMGPYAAIVQIYKNPLELPHKKVEIWISALAAIGFCLGFAFCGWKLARCLGGRITYLSPSRGFSAQLCALATILMASKARLPVSNTHIVVGAIVGVGLADNVKNVNWRLLLAFVAAWAMTIVSTCALSAGFFSFTIYSPAYSVVE